MTLRNAKKIIKRRAPKALNPEEVMECLTLYDERPSDFWELVDSTWDWAQLRRGGKLTERMSALDAHFYELSRTHNVCPVILLLSRGPK